MKGAWLATPPKATASSLAGPSQLEWRDTKQDTCPVCGRAGSEVWRRFNRIPLSPPVSKQAVSYAAPILGDMLERG